MVALGCLPGPLAARSGGPGRSAGRRGRLAQDARRRCGGVVALAGVAAGDLAAAGPALEPSEDRGAPPGEEHDPAERGEGRGEDGTGRAIAGAVRDQPTAEAVRLPGDEPGAGEDDDCVIAGVVRDQPVTPSGAVVAALAAFRAALRSLGVRPPHMPIPSAAARHSARTVQPAHSARAAA